MAGKRRAYAVVVTNSEDGYNDTLCHNAENDGPALYGSSKQAEEFINGMVKLGYQRSDYSIKRADLK